MLDKWRIQCSNMQWGVYCNVLDSMRLARLRSPHELVTPTEPGLTGALTPQERHSPAASRVTPQMPPGVMGGT